MPFELFCRFLASRTGDAARIFIVNTQSGDKAITAYWSPAVIWRVAGIVTKMVFYGFRSDKIVIFGSQRFVTIVVCLFAPGWVLLGKDVSTRIFGGAYDVYYRSMTFPVRWLVRTLMGRCSKIVVETRLVRDALADVWPAKLIAVPNYRESFDSMPDCRERNEGRTIFLYVGVIRHAKGIGELLDAFERLRSRRDEQDLVRSARLWLYGPVYDPVIGKHDLRATETLQQRNIAVFGNVSRDEIRGVLRSADVFVFPSYWDTEGHSGALLEAMSAGMPIIATRWRATAELVEDRVNGLLCAPRSSVELEHAMHELLVNRVLRCEFASGAAQAAQQYRPEIVCERLAIALDLSNVLGQARQ